MMLKIAISKVEKAAEKRKRESKRGRVMRTLLADQEANELQGFANDIKDALQVFKVCDGVFLPLVDSADVRDKCLLTGIDRCPANDSAIR